VASIPNSSRPVRPSARAAGAAATRRKNASTSLLADAVGSLLSSAMMPGATSGIHIGESSRQFQASLRVGGLPAQAGRSQTAVSWNTAPPAGGAGIGAGQRVDPDALLEGGVRPDALDDEHARAAARRTAALDHDAPCAVAEPHAVALAEPERGRVVGMDQRGRPALALREPGVSVKVVLRNWRAGAATSRNGARASPVDAWRNGPAASACPHGRADAPPSRAEVEALPSGCRSRRGSAPLEGQRAVDPAPWRRSSASGQPERAASRR
jgi:hypothetical protein